MNVTDISALLDRVTEWATGHVDVSAVALVGSHARGSAGPESDVDLVILCKRPDVLSGNKNWAHRFGAIDSCSEEHYGALRSLRIHYRAGLEVEFGITEPGWARLPLDDGSMQVLSNGVRVLYDEDGLLNSAVEAAAAWYVHAAAATS